MLNLKNPENKTTEQTSWGDDMPTHQSHQDDQLAWLRNAASANSPEDSSPTIEPAWQSNAISTDPPENSNPNLEPAWLHYPAPTDQPEDASQELKPAWLRQWESPDETPSPPVEQPTSSNTKDNLARDQIADSLRHKLGSNGSTPSASSPELEQTAQTDSFFNDFLQSIKRHGRAIVVGISCAIILFCSVGWFGFVNSPLYAAVFPPPTPRKSTALPTWPPTWTPIPTRARTSTPTVTPTWTPTVTLTPKPTRVPPTRTPRPPATLAPTTNPYIYNSIIRGCQHSGGTFIEGTVSSLYGEQVGARVTLGWSPGSNVIQTIVTGRDKSPGSFTFVLRADGSYPGVFYVWIADPLGKPLSDPNSGRIVTNAIKNGSDPAACWQAYVDFVASR